MSLFATERKLVEDTLADVTRDENASGFALDGDVRLKMTRGQGKRSVACKNFALDCLQNGHSRLVNLEADKLVTSVGK